MTIDHEDLIAEARGWPRDGVNEGPLINTLADALESTTARLREAEEARDKAKRAAVTLGQIVERHVEDTLRWAGMEDQIGTNDPDQQLAWELCAEMPGKIATLTASLREAEACIEKARKHLELSLGASAPMSTTHYILTAYKPTTENGSDLA